MEQQEHQDVYDAQEPGRRTVPVTISGRIFHLELVADAAGLMQGLSDQEEIAGDGGMLFVFPRTRVQGLVMRRCLVPIDAIFLGPDGGVVAAMPMVVEPPENRDDDSRLKVYSSKVPARFAIELRGGSLEDLAVKPGQKIELPVEVLRASAR